VPRRSPTLRTVASSLALAVFLVVLASACGERKPPPRVAAVAPAAAVPVAASGLRVYRDPVTGAFTQPPAPTPGLAPQPARPSPPALPVTIAPGGGKMVNLQGNFLSDVKATRGPRGVDVSCATTRTGSSK
jgi:hypothetical protein